MLHKLVHTLARHGLTGMLFRIRVVIVDWWFDLRYGVDTRGVMPLEELRISSDNKAAGYRYEPARVLPVRRLFRELGPELPQPTVLVDFGSGKGRILLIAAECGFARATGVEFASELCAIARSNCNAFRAVANTTTELTLIESDAVDYAVADDDNFLFFFNPFSEAVTAKVLGNILLSLQRHPRRVLLGFYNTDPAELVARYPVFSPWRNIDYRGYRVRLFTNSDGVQKADGRG